MELFVWAAEVGKRYVGINIFCAFICEIAEMRYLHKLAFFENNYKIRMKIGRS